jgi:precorrin-6B methylase 1
MRGPRLAEGRQHSPSPCAITSGFAFAAAAAARNPACTASARGERRRRERQHEHDRTGSCASTFGGHRFGDRGRASTLPARKPSLAAGVCAADNAGSPNAKANARHDSAPARPAARILERREAIIRARSNFAWTKGGAASADGRVRRFLAVPGTLYVVATPLGNLRDLTLRAIDVLGSADVIAAEDTRVSGVLLRHFGIATHPISVHEHNEAARSDEIVRDLRAGRSVALVSDAGTPSISDPGARLVRAVRAAGFPVVPIPGPCAAIAAVSAAGLDADRLLFLGFLPPAAKARRELLASVAREPCALVIYEARIAFAPPRRTSARRSAASGSWWSRARSRKNSRPSRK